MFGEDQYIMVPINFLYIRAGSQAYYITSVFYTFDAKQLQKQRNIYKRLKERCMSKVLKALEACFIKFTSDL